MLKRIFISQYFVIYPLLLIIICTSLVGNGIWNISHQASAQSIVPTLPPTISHNYTPTINNSFLTYQNSSTLGIAIQYPFNWKRIEADDKALIFLPRSENDRFSEKLTVAVFGINSSVSTGQLFSGAINNYGDQYRDFFIINSKPIILAGNPGYSLLYSYTDPRAGNITAMDIGIKDDNRAYVISYSAEQPEYYAYFPTIKKMIDSFQLIYT